MAIGKYQQLLVLQQSLFGLPWIIASILLAFVSKREILELPTPYFWAAIVIAFFSARALGMALNRLIDYKIDSKNPRTSRRPLQVGIISREEVKWVILVATILFILSCAFLNPLCLLLSPIVLFLLFTYSFTKRFTSLCHFVLGAIHFFAPIFAWSALTGAIDVTPVLLGCTLWLFISGNDMIYALQDRQFDMAEGLKSIPASMGVEKTLKLTRLIHFVAMIPLIVLGMVNHLSFIYYLGLFLLSLLYGYVHFRACGQRGLQPRLFDLQPLWRDHLLNFYIGSTILEPIVFRRIGRFGDCFRFSSFKEARRAKMPCASCDDKRCLHYRRL